MLKAQDSKPERVESLSVCLRVWTGNQTCLNYCKLMNITCILNHNKWPYLYNSGSDWGGLVGFWHFLYLCYFAACGLASLCGTVRWLKSKPWRKRLVTLTARLSPPPGLLHGAQQLQKPNRKEDLHGNRDEETFLPKDTCVKVWPQPIIITCEKYIGLKCMGCRKYMWPSGFKLVWFF